jgi:predicted RNase H-like HicB family nuclease
MSEPLKYQVIIYWSTEDDAFLAEVPELVGCVADGQTSEEALQNAHGVAREWIRTARDLGRAVPEPRGRLRYV